VGVSASGAAGGGGLDRDLDHGGRRRLELGNYSGAEEFSLDLDVGQSRLGARQNCLLLTWSVGFFVRAASSRTRRAYPISLFSEKMKSGRAFGAARGRPSGPAYPNLQAMIAKARAHEAEAEGRRLQWPLLGLIPLSVNAEVVRRAAERGELIAE
jgi:hypothetical protein